MQSKKDELVVGMTVIDLVHGNCGSPVPTNSLILLQFQAQAFCGSCDLSVMAYYWHDFLVFSKKGGKKKELVEDNRFVHWRLTCYDIHSETPLYMSVLMGCMIL